MIVKPLSVETDLASGTTVSSASVVRLYNSGTAAHLIVNNTTGNSFTMPAGSVSFMVKSPLDEITAANSDVKAVSVAYSIS